MGLGFGFCWVGGCCWFLCFRVDRYVLCFFVGGFLTGGFWCGLGLGDRLVLVLFVVVGFGCLVCVL